MIKNAHYIVIICNSTIISNSLLWQTGLVYLLLILLILVPYLFKRPRFLKLQQAGSVHWKVWGSLMWSFMAEMTILSPTKALKRAESTSIDQESHPLGVSFSKHSLIQTDTAPYLLLLLPLPVTSTCHNYTVVQKCTVLFPITQSKVKLF